MTKEEADAAVASSGIQVMEDAGRGYRRVVASPKPAEIIEIDTFKDLLEAGEVVIASGGGGIPVIRRGNCLLYTSTSAESYSPILKDTMGHRFFCEKSP